VILDKIPEIRRLSAEEKLMLLTELWDELTANLDEVPLLLVRTGSVRWPAGPLPSNRSSSPRSTPKAKLLVPDHPYGVFYAVEPSRVVIVAVLDLRQDPKAIEKRLRS
jgi:hypothetical protein